MQTVFSTRKTKFYGSEMKPLQKPAHRMLRMVMGQKTMRFPFVRSAKVREKRRNSIWKSYESGRFHSDLSSGLFQSTSKRFARIYMSRENEKLWYKQHLALSPYGGACRDKSLVLKSMEEYTETLTTAWMAERAGVTQRTVQHWLKRGELHATAETVSYHTSRRWAVANPLVILPAVFYTHNGTSFDVSGVGGTPTFLPPKIR